MSDGVPMQRETGVDKAPSSQGIGASESGQSSEAGEAVEASGDAIVIADAIFGGFQLLATAFDRLTKAINDQSQIDEHGAPQEASTYLDGKSIE